MSGRRTAVQFALVIAGTWAGVVLFETPRGDRICEVAGRLLFPAWVTGESIVMAGQKVSDGGSEHGQEEGKPADQIQK